jgi:hypothetical protein
MIPNNRPLALFEPELVKRLAEAARAPYEALARASEALGTLHFERFSESLAHSLEPLRETLARLPGDTRKALKVLGEHGWFIDMEMPLPAPRHLQELLEQGDTAQAEAWLTDYYRDRMPDILKELCARFPARARIFTLAWQAHERGEYELSVPVCLAQADGICRDLTSFQLFRKKFGLPQVAAYVASLPADKFTTALLEPLTVVLPISASEGQRPPDSTELNRHSVLHGEAVDYGTEINSLKAISLLQYVSSVLGRPSDRADAA